MNKELLNLTLLYVEDDEDTRNSLLSVLQNKVSKVYVARDGEEALEIFKKHPIHFVLSDFQMPRMDGNQLCGILKEMNSELYFVMLTAYDDSELLMNAIDAGVDKFLKKPVEAKKLFKIMDDIQEKILRKFEFEKSRICLQEAEKVAHLSYWDVNLHSKVITFSKEAKELFNLSLKPYDILDYMAFSSVVQEEDKIRFSDIFSQRVFQEEKIDEVVVIKKSDNESVYIHIAAKKWTSSACGTNHIIGQFQDISRYEIQRLELLKDSQSDPVLQVYNKKFLILKLDNLIKSSKRYGHPICVIFFDIDNFKHINDTYGHLAADDILVELTNLIQENIRQSDFFGRWGGDEFVIITEFYAPDTVVLLMEKLLDKVQNNLWIEDMKLTISMGASFYEAGDDVNSLLHKADLKMFEAKKCGKNGCVW